MAFEPLVLRHNTEIDDVDASDQVIAVKFSGTRNSVEVPATGGTAVTFAPGDTRWMVELEILTDTDATSISEIMFDLLDDTDGTMKVGGTMRAGAVGPGNARYTGTALATGWELGGKVNTVGTQTVRMPLLGKPTKVTS